jgi:hypothetical protein
MPPPNPLNFLSRLLILCRTLENVLSTATMSLLKWKRLVTQFLERISPCIECHHVVTLFEELRVVKPKMDLGNL